MAVTPTSVQLKDTVDLLAPGSTPSQQFIQVRPSSLLGRCRSLFWYLIQDVKLVLNTIVNLAYLCWAWIVSVARLFSFQYIFGIPIPSILIYVLILLSLYSATIFWPFLLRFTLTYMVPFINILIEVFNFLFEITIIILRVLFQIWNMFVPFIGMIIYVLVDVITTVMKLVFDILGAIDFEAIIQAIMEIAFFIVDLSLRILMVFIQVRMTQLQILIEVATPILELLMEFVEVLLPIAAWILEFLFAILEPILDLIAAIAKVFSWMVSSSFSSASSFSSFSGASSAAAFFNSRKLLSMPERGTRDLQPLSNHPSTSLINGVYYYNDESPSLYSDTKSMNHWYAQKWKRDNEDIRRMTSDDLARQRRNTEESDASEQDYRLFLLDALSEDTESLGRVKSLLATDSLDVKSDAYHSPSSSSFSEEGVYFDSGFHSAEEISLLNVETKGMTRQQVMDHLGRKLLSLRNTNKIASTVWEEREEKGVSTDEQSDTQRPQYSASDADSQEIDHDDVTHTISNALFSSISTKLKSGKYDLNTMKEWMSDINAANDRRLQKSRTSGTAIFENFKKNNPHLFGKVKGPGQVRFRREPIHPSELHQQLMREQKDYMRVRSRSSSSSNGGRTLLAKEHNSPTRNTASSSDLEEMEFLKDMKKRHAQMILKQAEVHKQYHEDRGLQLHLVHKGVSETLTKHAKSTFHPDNIMFHWNNILARNGYRSAWEVLDDFIDSSEDAQAFVNNFSFIRSITQTSILSSLPGGSRSGPHEHSSDHAYFTDWSHTHKSGEEQYESATTDHNKYHQYSSSRRQGEGASSGRRILQQNNADRDVEEEEANSKQGKRGFEIITKTDCFSNPRNPLCLPVIPDSFSFRVPKFKPPSNLTEATDCSPWRNTGCLWCLDRLHNGFQSIRFILSGFIIPLNFALTIFTLTVPWLSWTVDWVFLIPKGEIGTVFDFVCYFQHIYDLVVLLLTVAFFFHVVYPLFHTLVVRPLLRCRQLRRQSYVLGDDSEYNEIQRRKIDAFYAELLNHAAYRATNGQHYRSWDDFTRRVDIDPLFKRDRDERRSRFDDDDIQDEEERFNVSSRISSKLNNRMAKKSRTTKDQEASSSTSTYNSHVTSIPVESVESTSNKPLVDRFISVAGKLKKSQVQSTLLESHLLALFKRIQDEEFDFMSQGQRENLQQMLNKNRQGQQRRLKTTDV